MNIIKDPKIIDEILQRGTIVEVLPSLNKFRDKLLSGEKLRFYIGFDATAPTLHLSHAKNFMLMEKFRKLGHEVIILFGDFTAMIGDPTGESSTRKQLSREQVLENVKQWKKLVKPLMNFEDSENPPQIKYNYDWLSKLNLEDVLRLASNFTVQQMIQRDMFQKRLEEDKPIFLHEFLYPLIQGFDSVAMDVDVELSGTDQIFNSLVGRTLQERINKKEKYVVAVTLMANPKTGELMSKSKGIGVFLDASPDKMYGQIMSQPDEMLRILFINNTNLTISEIDKILASENPRDAKMRLALEIVKIFYGESASKNAQDEFIKIFKDKGTPEDITEYVVHSNKVKLTDLLLETSLASSKTEARKFILQAGIKVDGKIIKEDTLIEISRSGAILQRGKRRFVKIILK